MENENIQVAAVTKDYSTLSLVLGILSIVLSCCTGVFTFWFGLAATILGKKTMKGDPENKKGKPGFICGIIGMIISVLGTIFWIVYLFIGVGLASVFSGNLFNADYNNDYQYEYVNSPSGYSEEATYEKFITLEIGMTLKEVQGILGEGEDNGGGDFGWRSGSGNIYVTFDAKGNLEYMKQSITEGEENISVNKENLDKIVMGMNIKEVEAVLGEGTLLSVELYDNVVNASYGWIGPEVVIYVNLADGKVVFADAY